MKIMNLCNSYSCTSIQCKGKSSVGAAPGREQASSRPGAAPT